MRRSAAVSYTHLDVYKRQQPLDADIVDAFCLMQKGFTDQFVYYRKDRPTRFMGLGRCIALPTLDLSLIHISKSSMVVITVLTASKNPSTTHSYLKL